MVPLPINCLTAEALTLTGCGGFVLGAYDQGVISKSGRLTPEQQLKVLTHIWGEDEEMGGFVFLPWIPGWTNSKEERRANWNEGPAFEWPREKARVLEHIQAHTSDDLYFSVNIFLHPSRVVQNLGESFALYADLDEVDPRVDIDRDMRPTIAWESSPDRFQGVWLMRGMEWDAAAPGGLNQRLSAAIGADPSGWDATQVLRVPGRNNFKFDYKDDDTPAVPGRLLWVNTKRYEWTFFDERLPQVKTYDTGQEVEEADIDRVDRHAIWGKVRLKCSAVVREYMAMKRRDVESSEHDRSEVLWQIERDLADQGCSAAEIMAIIRPTPWNKYAGRRNELAQLRTEALKAIGVAQEEAGEETLEQVAFDGTRPKELPTLASLTDVTIPRPHWLVRNVWTVGSCGFIAGQPKSYKSWFGLDLAISVATGTPFLNDVQFSTGKPRNVIYLQEEDSLPLVLHRAGQVVEEKLPDAFWHGQLTFDVSSPSTGDSGRSGTLSDVVWTPPRRVESLAMLIRAGFIASDPGWQSWLTDQVEAFDAAMVVIDTLGTTVGGIDTDKSGDLNTKVLKPLKAIAEQHNCAIVIIHHNKKGNDDKSRSGQQMLGSVALHAWVESALYIQSKEQLTGQPAEVKVERENKLAEDMKFRVRVPTMFAERGDEANGRRQLWEPTVLSGWGDPDPQPIDDDKPTRRGRREGHGATIANKMEEEGGRKEPINLHSWCLTHGGANRYKQLKQEVTSAVTKGWLKEIAEDLYLVVN